MSEIQKVEKKRKLGLEEVILSLCAERGAGRTISPMVVAQAFAEGRKGDDGKASTWARDVRSAAIGLARAGKIVIFRKGKPADPEDFRGIYRLGLPTPDGTPEATEADDAE